MFETNDHIQQEAQLTQWLVYITLHTLQNN